ncbi:cell division protein FtsQ [Flavobacteriaceae bacterium F08102]|nr:cell division protein FtsQ [Flavobacteriaceae bacterium F08102]
MKRYIPYLKGILLIGFIVFLYSFSSKRHERKKIELGEIKFENGDNMFLTYPMVNKLLIQNPGGLNSQPKEELFLNKLEKNLFSNQMVENADVFLSVDRKLGAIIKQKTPIARVNQGEYSYYIDDKGKPMPLSSNYSARVPIVEGVKNENITAELYALVSFIDKDEFLKKQIVGIVQKEGNRFDLKTRIGNLVVTLGTIDKLAYKTSKLKVFFQKAIKDNTLKNYSKINLVYSNQVVCTKK